MKPWELVKTWRVEGIPAYADELEKALREQAEEWRKAADKAAIVVPAATETTRVPGVK